MVMHRDEENNCMEVGMLVLDQKEGHIPRILTYRNGVLDGVNKITESDLMEPWVLKVDMAVGSGPSMYTNGSIRFDRETHPDPRDFRWIMDLEARDFYNRDLSREMLKGILKPILQVPHGEFYTRLKTRPMKRKNQQTNVEEDFGCVASATACDIVLTGKSAELRKKSGGRVFTFKVEPNTTYELSNTPPDVGHVHEMAPHTGEHPHTAPTTPPAAAARPADHFQFYYKLFPQAFAPKFEFGPPDAEPAPDPFLCGVTAMGKRSAGLGYQEE